MNINSQWRKKKVSVTRLTSWSVAKNSLQISNASCKTKQKHSHFTLLHPLIITWQIVMKALPKCKVQKKINQRRAVLFHELVLWKLDCTFLKQKQKKEVSSMSQTSVSQQEGCRRTNTKTIHSLARQDDLKREETEVPCNNLTNILPGERCG